jgi:hypothetical protein
MQERRLRNSQKNLSHGEKMFGKPKYHVEVWSDCLGDFPWMEYSGTDLDKAMHVFVEEALLRDSVRKANRFGFKHVLRRGKMALVVDEHEYVPPLHKTTHV